MNKVESNLHTERAKTDGFYQGLADMENPIDIEGGSCQTEAGWHRNAKLVGLMAALLGFLLVLFDDLMPRHQQGLPLFSELSEILEFIVLCPGFGLLAFVSTQYIYQREFDLKLKIERLEARRFIALGRITGSIAHEVRNPLHNIKLILGELREQLGSEQYNLLNHLDENVERINMAVKLVYELAKPGYHIEDDLVNNIVLKTVVDRALLRIRSEFDIPITVENIGADLIVVGQMTSILFALENVLRNAAQYCVAHADTRGICLRVLSERQFYILQIMNHGQLPKALLHGEAETFTTKQSGLGLGLFIARHLLVRMQGQLKLEQSGDQVIISFILQKGVHYAV